MKKIKELKLLIEKELFTRRALCGLILQMFLFFLIPLLYISRYNHASGDCYWFAFRAHCAWLNTHNIFEVLKAAFTTIGEFYTSWQGTFTSIFFFAISPVAFGEQYMFIVPYMMIGMTCFSTFFLYYVLLKKLLQFDGYTYLAISAVASLIQFEFMYTPASGIYWYNGAVHYVFMQGFVNLTLAFSLLLLSAINNIQRRRTILYIVCTCISGFFASGANFSTTLLNAELAVLLELAAIFLWKRSKNKKYLLYTIPFTVSFAGFLVNICAPGNAVRQSNFQKGTFGETILSSFTYSATQAADWISIFVIIYLILLLPFILKAVTRTSFRFPYPLLLLLGCYCLYASMFAPGFYAFGGEAPLSRNQNICKMFLFLCLIFCEIYIAGWTVKKLSFMKHLVPTHGKNVWSWTIVTAICCIMFIYSFLQLDYIEKKASFVSYGAYDVIQTKHGELYHNEYLIRLNEYKNNPDTIVYVQSYTVQPYPLWVTLDTETTAQESGILNASLSKWYNKKAIIEVKAK